MSKRGSFEIKRKILISVREKPMSYAELVRKVNTGFNTVKNNCEELMNFGFLNIEKLKKHSRNGREYFQVKITSNGLNFLAEKT